MLGSLIGGALGLLGGMQQNKASANALAAQERASQAALEFQKQQYGDFQKNISPYLDAGKTGLAGAVAGLGQGPAAQQQQYISNLQSNPIYQALTKSQEDALLQNAAATGGLRGGNTQSALADNRASLLGSFENQQFNRNMNFANLGQNSAVGAGAQGANYANQQAQILGNQAGARANAAITQGNNNASMLAGLGNQISQSDYWNSFLNKPKTDATAGQNYGNTQQAQGGDWFSRLWR